VHVRRRPRRRLRLVARLRVLLHLLELLGGEELLVHVLRPFERRVRGVAPEALEVRLTIGRARRLVRLRRRRGGARTGLLIGSWRGAQRHHGERDDQAGAGDPNSIPHL
jgi:hypothetical protein